jgi:hypothetical protein
LNLMRLSHQKKILHLKYVDHLYLIWEKGDGVSFA